MVAVSAVVSALSRRRRHQLAAAGADAALKEEAAAAAPLNSNAASNKTEFCIVGLALLDCLLWWCDHLIWRCRHDNLRILSRSPRAVSLGSTRR